MRGWRWWLANAGSFTLVCWLAIPLALGLGQTWLGVVAAAVGLASLVQGLRNLWAASRVKAFFLAGLVPILLMASVWYGGQGDLIVLLLGLPAAVATGVEVAVRLWRGAHGLPDPTGPQVRASIVSPPPSARTSSQRGRGALVLLGLAVAVAALSAWTLRAPVRNAAAFRAELRPGMTLGEVAIAAWPHGRYVVWVRSALPEPPQVTIGAGGAQVGLESVEGEAAVRQILDRAGVELKVQTVGFVFLTSVPARSSVVVHFGPDGRVSGIDDPVHQSN